MERVMGICCTVEKREEINFLNYVILLCMFFKKGHSILTDLFHLQLFNICNSFSYQEINRNYKNKILSLFPILKY